MYESDTFVLLWAVSQFIARHLFGGVEQTERFLGKLTSVLMAWWNWLFRDISNIVLHIECRYVIARLSDLLKYFNIIHNGVILSSETRGKLFINLSSPQIDYNHTSNGPSSFCIKL